MKPKRTCNLIDTKGVRNYETGYACLICDFIYRPVPLLARVQSRSSPVPPTLDSPRVLVVPQIAPEPILVRRDARGEL